MSGRLRKPTMTMATCKAVTLSIPREAAATHRKNARAADEPAWQAPHADPLHGEAEASSAPLSHGAGWKGEGRRCGDRKSVVWGKSVSVGVDPGGRRIIKKKKRDRKYN